MRYLKYLILLAAVLALPTVHSQAQVAIGVQIGPTYGIYNAPPVCEWGFYPTYPFGCAPYGYYGPEWFVNGVFIGAGPWANFYYARPAYYRPYYFRSVWYVNRFHDRDRFIVRDRGFRTFRGEHDFDRGRSFHDSREFRGGGFDRDRGFDRGREFHGGDRGFRGGESHGGGNRGGESHAGNRGWRR